MKIIQNKTKVKSKKILTKKEEIVIVAQETKFARVLCGNNKKLRDRVIRALKKWISNCCDKNYVFKEDDFVRLWLGLFHAVWNSDKPLVQEELCEDISGIMDVFPPSSMHAAALMMKAGLRVLATRWYGIDQHRMDKFLMLVRRLLRGWLRFLKSCSWSLQSCQMSSQLLVDDGGLLSPETPPHARNALSLRLHFTEIYLEELAKVCAGELTEAGALVELLRPFAQYLAAGDERALQAACRTHIFYALIRQSEQGQLYEDKTRAWLRMKCPEGGPDALERVEDGADSADDAAGASDDEPQSVSLDPRAGRVDVILHPLPVPAAALAHMLHRLARTTSSATHTRLKLCADRFLQLSQGEYPLKTDALALDLDSKPLKTKAKRRSADKLKNFEKKLLRDSDELQLRGVNKKQRKRILKATQQAVHTANGEWKIENTIKQLRKLNIKMTSKKKSETVSGSDKENARSPSRGTKRPPPPGARTDHAHKMPRLTDTGGPAPPSTSQIDKTKRDKSKTRTNKTKPTVLANKLNKFSKDNKINKCKKVPRAIVTPRKDRHSEASSERSYHTPKNVKFVLKNNRKQGLGDYYQSVRRSPAIPYDGERRPARTNLKPHAPSPLNPFHKHKLRTRN